MKSKEFYNMYKFQLSVTFDTVPVSNYLSYFCTKKKKMFVFNTKVLLEKEIKLKEFNFKLLHGILPCNENLVKWKIHTNSNCDACIQPQTLEHLLYDCCYEKRYWNIVENVFGLDISYHKILGLEEDFHYNGMVTLVAFIIYKEWLLLNCLLKTNIEVVILMLIILEKN